MFSSFDICLALDCVKNICENNHCVVCDKPAEEFMRYSCGHTVCESCASGTGGCYICLTPPDQSTSNFKLDEVSKQRAVNASVLLKAFEKAFSVDVFKHQRMSEQLKLEKDLFPKCIQAPRKYFNKRKSLGTNVKKKKNRISMLPGEVVSQASKRMGYSINSVRQWLNSNKENVIKNQNKDENDESGIVIDASIIDCSQITEDKDEQALLAVYEADKKEMRSASVLTIESEEWEDNDSTVEHPRIYKDQYKVPFFKKSKLAGSNMVCDDENILTNRSRNKFDQTRNLQITISYNNQSISPCQLIQKETLHTHSTSVQTDICELSYLKDLNNLQDVCENSSVCSNLNVLSQDVFTSEEIYKDLKADTSNIGSNAASKSVIINESDSDGGSAAEVSILEVSAQIHNIGHPVFSDITYIDSHEQFKRQQRRRPRHLTPDSSNSSEKENLNPNKRQKKSKTGKKSKK